MLCTQAREGQYWRKYMGNPNQTNDSRFESEANQQSHARVVAGNRFSPGQWLGYTLFLIICCVLAFAIIHYYPLKYHEYQVNQERYAAERALDSLEKGDIDAARDEVELLKTERPIYVGGLFDKQFSDVWKGPVLRNRVNIYEKLTAALLKSELIDEAEAICWKAILEYHTHSRGLEMLVPWELMLHIQTLRRNWEKAWGCARILAAHGVDQVRYPEQMHPDPFSLDAGLLSEGKKNFPVDLMKQLKNHGEATTPTEFSDTAKILRLHVEAKQIPDPGIRRNMINLAHLSMIQSEQRDQAREFFIEQTGYDPSFNDVFWLRWPWTSRLNLLNRDPTTLELLWRERPPDCRLQAKHFLGSFKNDGRITQMKFRDVTVQQNGYFNPSNRYIQEKDEDKLHLFQNVAISMTVKVDRPVHQVCLAYEATPVLGIYPILLMQIDDETPHPLYMEPARRDIAVEDLGRIFPNQDLMTVNVYLDPGTHEFVWTFINDFGFTWDQKDETGRRVEENRDVLLHRLALVHISPSY
jgi:hypothetical protein